MRSEFASWMDRFNLEFPGKLKPDEDDEMSILLKARGIEHEKNHLQSLRQAGKDICELESKRDRYAATLKAMREGRQIIYQAALQSGNFAGYADFLIRENDKSALGDYHYQVWDTKLALSPKPYFLIQLCGYAEMLAEIQGERSPIVGVILGNGQPKCFRTEDYFYYYLELKEAFLEQQKLFDSQQTPPEVTDNKNHGRWETLAKQFLEESDHLSRVANIRRVQIKKLHRAGIKTMKDLAVTNFAHIKDMEPSILQTLKQQARLQVESAGLAKPKYETIKTKDINPRRGLALLPPASDNDIYFDMEGYPNIEDGLEYLFGVTYTDQGQLKFKDWWAHNLAEEKLAFEGFIDWAYERWTKDPTMHIYHYGNYEVGRMRLLMGRHGTRGREIDDFLIAGVFVDLFTIVKQSLCIGEPKYSIKNIEHIYMDGRMGEVATALESVVQYHRWLLEQDGADWTTSKILAAIRAYNKDDCDSIVKLTNWLRQIQSEQSMVWIPKPPRPDGESDAAIARTETTKLAQELLLTLPAEPEPRVLQELLAHLLEFHDRERKATAWAMFDRHEMTEAQLIDDIDCLGGLTRTKRQKEQIKQSFYYEYKFDPGQETKISKGSTCFFAHDLSKSCTVHALDREIGIATIKMGIGQPVPPEQLSLIPNENVSAKKISQSVYDTIAAWKNSGKLPQAIEDFLLRKRPRIKGSPAGPIIAEDSDVVQGTITAVLNLDNSTLCIQGPPGAGKTYTAAQAIVALLKNHKTIGITSNSHKAIAKLMEEVTQRAAEQKIRFSGTKIQSDQDQFLLEGTGIQPCKNAMAAFNSGTHFQLVGGTAWAFSDPETIGKLDYLFVDEAGQVSIANLVGMGRSTNNIVLIGDQMQLSQPTKAVHPGNSGQSTLQFLLQDHQTIPVDFGIFLATTWRMHPNVCKFISEAIYEGRLHAEQHTKNRVLIIPEEQEGSAGIIYMPVAHDGNEQASDEEAAVIKEYIEAILATYRVRDKNGITDRQLQAKDILIVAPYNMQVRKISELMPGASVGSVDKFQGQEAPIVMISMCSSSGDASPRGLEFLFSKNRLNVAISRAEVMAIVVANPALARTKCSTVEDMELVNLFCKIKHCG